jgi:hypothetical protein
MDAVPARKARVTGAQINGRKKPKSATLSYTRRSANRFVFTLSPGEASVLTAVAEHALRARANTSIGDELIKLVNNSRMGSDAKAAALILLGKPPAPPASRTAKQVAKYFKSWYQSNKELSGLHA